MSNLIQKQCQQVTQNEKYLQPDETAGIMWELMEATLFC